MDAYSPVMRPNHPAVPNLDDTKSLAMGLEHKSLCVARASRPEDVFALERSGDAFDIRHVDEVCAFGAWNNAVRRTSTSTSVFVSFALRVFFNFSFGEIDTYNPQTLAKYAL